MKLIFIARMTLIMLAVFLLMGVSECDRSTVADDAAVIPAPPSPTPTPIPIPKSSKWQRAPPRVIN